MTSPWATKRSFRQEVGEHESVALHHLARLHRDTLGEHRPGVAEAVKLTVLAAGVYAARQLVEQRIVKRTPGKFTGQMPMIHAAQLCTQAIAYHVTRQPRRVQAPDRKYRRDAGVGGLVDAIGADVLEKQITEGHVRDAGRDRAFDQDAHALFVFGVRAR